MATAAPNMQPVYVMDLVGSHTQNTTLSSAQTVTVAAVSGAVPNAILLSAQAQDICFTLDGTTPTATKGLILKAGAGAVLIPVKEGQVLKFFEFAASAKLDYQLVKLGS
jgi:hypothetical protein